MTAKQKAPQIGARDRPGREFVIRGNDAIAVGAAMLVEYVPSPDGPETYIYELLLAMEAASSGSQIQAGETPLSKQMANPWLRNRKCGGEFANDAYASVRR